SDLGTDAPLALAAILRQARIARRPRWWRWGWLGGERLSRARRKGDACLPKDSCHCRRGVGTNEPVLVGYTHARFAQLIEFAQQRSPFHVAAGIPGKIVELLLQQEGKEGAEDMAADGGVR